MKRALLINPPIYDFSAYDFWLKPYGLLKIARRLMRCGWNVELYDFTFRNPFDKNYIEDAYGRGPFPARVVEKPEVLRFVPRYFRRFGTSREDFLNFVKGKAYDFILITCAMTYWYPGVFEVINLLKKAGIKGRVLLGGGYSIFEGEHAELRFGRDAIIVGDVKSLEAITGVTFEKLEEEVPAWELYPHLRYGVVRLTYGCSYKCTYCGVRRIFPGGFKRLPEEEVLEEIKLLLRLGVKDIAFYDDALLEAGLDFIKSVIKPFAGVPLRFHTPNAMHARRIDGETASFLREAGFETIFLGYEFGRNDVLGKTGAKVKVEECERAVDALRGAGYSSESIVLYVMICHPLQGLDELREDIFTASRLKVRVMLSEFSPIRGTPDGDMAIEKFGISDPLLANKIAFTVNRYGWENVCKIKLYVKEMNRNFLKAAGG